ncbi:MAG TPA: hypothetical protein VEX35_01575 [Allosphingosinicella sp.]|nr:hypothetical protein [Allosphingosinicella sp.]
MSLAFLLFVQAATAPAAPPPPPTARLLRIDFDLGRHRPAGGGSAFCPGAGADPGEVVVCGPRRQGGNYPFAQWARTFATRPLLAEIGVGGNMRGDVHVESVAMDRGAVSNRVMVRLTVPF